MCSHSVLTLVALLIAGTAAAQDQQPHSRPGWPCVGRPDPVYVRTAEATGGQVFLFDHSEVGHSAALVLAEQGHEETIFRVSGSLEDGTHEFSLRGREDWAVHIALWQRAGADGPAALGLNGPDGGITDAAVALPARGEVYRTDTVTPPPARIEGPIRVTASANRPPAVLWRLRDMMDIELVRIGSAGAKAMAVVRGDVDAYLHAGGQWEWDSAAPAGVVRGFAGLDSDDVRADRAHRESGGDPRDHIGGGQVPVQQQHLDQRSGAAGVTMSLAGGGPERLMRRGEHSGRAGLHQRGRVGQCAGFALQHLEVVVQDQGLAALEHDPFMGGDDGATVERGHR